MSERETALKALTEYVMYHGAVHAEDCPEDDTCDCLYAPLNAGVNKAIRMLAALPPAAVPQTCAWREIATAPKDGKWMLVDGMNGYYGRVVYACYGRNVEGEPCWLAFLPTMGVCQIAEPSHWMPLPAPPVPRVLVPAEET